jgi:hypothetical protein
VGKTYHSFKLPIGNTGKTTKFIVVDSNPCDLDEEQKKWYENELNFTEGPVITVCHHPKFYPENRGL